MKTIDMTDRFRDKLKKSGEWTICQTLVGSQCWTWTRTRRELEALGRRMLDRCFTVQYRLDGNQKPSGRVNYRLLTSELMEGAGGK